MITRTESAATTRQALLQAAGLLLDEGGPSAVTLREVGARAGVSRGAPYRHFADKESLVTALGAASWDNVADVLSTLHGRADLSPEDRLRAALLALIDVGRIRPHLYRVMFSTPSGDPDSVVRAASRAQDEFLSIVGGIVGDTDARHFGALLLTAAHGIAGMELSGHLTAEKWQTSAEELVGTVVTLVTGRAVPHPS